MGKRPGERVLDASFGRADQKTTTDFPIVDGLDHQLVFALTREVPSRVWRGCSILLTLRR